MRYMHPILSYKKSTWIQKNLMSTKNEGINLRCKHPKYRLVQFFRKKI